MATLESEGRMADEDFFIPLPDLDADVCRDGSWLTFNCDAAYEDEAAAFVVQPREFGIDSKPAPVLLYLSGKGHVDDREDFMVGGVDILLRNPAIRNNFFVVAPKGSTKTGLVTYTSSWQLEWATDAVWALFTEILRRLGPSKINPTRLSATGISLGAAGVWDLGLKYGQFLAAVVPVSGSCTWQGCSWTNEEAVEAVAKKLRSLSLRAYHVDVDWRAGHPLKDIEWLAHDRNESSGDMVLPGLEDNATIEVNRRTWSDPVGCLELWLAKGPLTDWSFWGSRGDSHCLWYRAYALEEWGLATFLLEHYVPEDRKWHFETMPSAVDTTLEKRRLEEEWAAHKRAKQD